MNRRTHYDKQFNPVPALRLSLGMKPNILAAWKIRRRVGNQAGKYCKDEYSILQSEKQNLKTAISEYEGSAEETSCLQPDGRPPLFPSMPVPLPVKNEFAKSTDDG